MSRRHARLAVLLAAALGAVAVYALGSGGAFTPRTGEPSLRGSDDRFLLGGIQVNEPDLDAWLDALEAAGMNTVSVTDYARQGDWDSAHLTWDEDRSGVVAEIRAARRRGLDVVLILRVALDHAFERNRFLWHGLIQPANDALLDAWFERYTRFARGWAEVAQREGVEALGIGSELNALTSTRPVDALPSLEEYYLNSAKRARRRGEILAHREAIDRRDPWLRDRPAGGSLESYLDARTAAEEAWARQVVYQPPGSVPVPEVGQEGPANVEATPRQLERINDRRRRLEAHWEALIAELRGVYDGRLGYAANFDQYRQVGFWSHLDWMGVNAYFPLRDRWLPHPDSAALYPLLVAGWRGVLDEIEGFRREEGLAGKPVLFTEMGLTYRANSTLAPWADTGFSLVRSAVPGDGEHLLVWQEQPPYPRERALAVRALEEARRETGERFLAGVLYWKLSTVPAHHAIEPFVLILGQHPEDPLLPALRSLRGTVPWQAPSAARLRERAARRRR